MSDNKPRCLACERDDSQTPLINLIYQDKKLYICPQHMPSLIHNPGQLVGKLPGAENMSPAE